ncbi:g11937 [Coccomyxa viridis]|uniref:G11937 protein n=1 Tax=Coccomyxa viridis TaxID=1274662 RepID=A0ABP1G964_9CHLO
MNGHDPLPNVQGQPQHAGAHGEDNPLPNVQGQPQHLAALDQQQHLGRVIAFIFCMNTTLSVNAYFLENGRLDLRLIGAHPRSTFVYLCPSAEDRRILAAVRVDNEGFADLNELSIVQFPGSEERPLYMRPAAQLRPEAVVVTWWERLPSPMQTALGRLVNGLVVIALLAGFVAVVHHYKDHGFFNLTSKYAQAGLDVGGSNNNLTCDGPLAIPGLHGPRPDIAERRIDRILNDSFAYAPAESQTILPGLTQEALRAWTSAHAQEAQDVDAGKQTQEALAQQAAQNTAAEATKAKQTTGLSQEAGGVDAGKQTQEALAQQAAQNTAAEATKAKQTAEDVEKAGKAKGGGAGAPSGSPEHGLSQEAGGVDAGEMQVSRGGQALHASHRTIIHLDLDCFYAQVEQKRLGIPAEVPCAVQQWEGLIAINYAGRAQGITRHMRLHEAKARCPELICVHVQTTGGDEEDTKDRTKQKACLERYRKACIEIMGVLNKAAPQATIEKASIDDVYIDVTAIVDKELQEQAAADNCRGLNEQEGGAHDAGCFPIDTFAWGSIVLGKFLDISSEFDRRLSIGASIACCIEAPSATN